ncbi:Uncharacterized protein GBIM_01176 [Gryllus bimaculatus]|nr:Uncharacterized protein GBIM_01176 [Gryllus bimaculatus]
MSDINSLQYHVFAVSVSVPGLAILVLVVAVVLATLGLVTCVVSHYRAGGGGLGGRARSWHSEHPPPGPAPTAPMLALQPGMERLSHEMRDRQVRLHSVSTDLELDLPPNIALPDGEEIPYGSSTRLQIRDPEQESEIYQKCIRPPPNRTVFDGESPPPYRSSSAGLLALGAGAGAGAGASDWSSGSGSSGPHVVRCHSLSSSSSSSSSSASSSSGWRRRRGGGCGPVGRQVGAAARPAISPSARGRRGGVRRPPWAVERPCASAPCPRRARPGAAPSLRPRADALSAPC